MREFTDVIFDLDGTLIDSSVGILESFRSVLNDMGQGISPNAELSYVIGPPLRHSFQSLLSTEDHEVIEAAVSAYHRHFSATGIQNNSLYPGIRTVLEQLRSKGVRIHLATAKEEIYPCQILAGHSIDGLFQSIYGASFDGSLTRKKDIIFKLLRNERLDPNTAAMIGDRAEDVTGGRENGLFTIGVTYGFGSAEELIQSLPDVIIRSPDEILDALGVHDDRTTE